MSATISYQNGMLCLAGKSEHAPIPFQFAQNRWCCEAYHYQAVLPWLQEQSIRDAVPRWRRLALKLHETRQLHAYQMQALEAWKGAGGRGSIMLPIGAAKTLLAVNAIHAISASTVILVPTVQMLSQWYALLSHAFGKEIGVYYSDMKRVRPLTVTVSEAARDLIAEHGNSFALVVCDEVQHVPIQILGETLRMAPAPFRLGLLSASPEEREPSEWQQIDDLFGPTVYTLRLDTLTGEQRAAYRTQRILVDLTDHERTLYSAARAAYMGYVYERGLQHSHGAVWLQELQRLSTVDPEARRAWLARAQMLKLLESCRGKFAALERLLLEYDGERVLVYTESRELAYAISRRYLVAAVTPEIEPAERKYILDAFRDGRYRVIVVSGVIKLGVDVSQAKAVIALGDGARTRTCLQGIGRSLRKKDLLQTMLIQVLVRDTLETEETSDREVSTNWVSGREEDD